MLSRRRPEGLSGITVCIDPGHQQEGQFITEPIGPGLEGTKRSSAGMARGTETRRMESIVVLEIAFVLRDVLLSQGATVVMTRNTQETYVSNIDRAGIATEADADVFLRLHGNNRDETNIQGIVVYAPFGSDYAKAIADTDGWRTMSELMLAGHTECHRANQGQHGADQQLYWQQLGADAPIS